MIQAHNEVFHSIKYWPFLSSDYLPHCFRVFALQCLQHWRSNKVERFAPFATIWLLLIQTDWSKEPRNKANYSCVLCVRWRIVHAQCALGSQWKSRMLCAAEQKWHHLLTLFNSCLQVPFIEDSFSSFREEDPLALYVKSALPRQKRRRKLLLRPALRNISQSSLFQWLSEGIKWNFINKSRNCLVLYSLRWRGLSAWGTGSLSGPSSASFAVRSPRPAASGGLL